MDQLPTMRLATLIPLLLVVACSTPQGDTPLQMALSSTQQGTLDIHLTDVPGDTLIAVTQGEVSAYSVAWHPDGNQIAYGTRNDSITAIMRLNLDTGRTDTLLAGAAYFGEPDWSADGSELAYISDLDMPGRPMGAGRELYLMDVASGAIDRLTEDELYQGAPRYSPDGGRLAYCELVPPGDGPATAAVMIREIEEGQTTALTDASGFDCLPAWSPDGSQIVFHRCSPEGCSIWTINIDGSSPIRVDTGDMPAQWPAWSPDGEWIAFTTLQDNQTDIYRIRPDGTDLEQVTSAPSREEAAEWRPFR